LRANFDFEIKHQPAIIYVFYSTSSISGAVLQGICVSFHLGLGVSPGSLSTLDLGEMTAASVALIACNHPGTEDSQ